MVVAPHDLASAALDALAAHIAVVDHAGIIVGVNRSWNRFARDNAGVDGCLGTGCNYFAICEAAAKAGDSTAAAMLAGLDEVLSGRNREFLLEYPCHSPDTRRWFLARVTRCEWGDRAYAVVAHEDITARIEAETALREADSVLRNTLEELRAAKRIADAANAELELALAREKDAARTDELTGAHNRRYFFDVAEQLFGIARRYRQPLSVVMLDVDHFKRFNDLFGHAMGDRALVDLVATVKEHLRAADVFARYGGEEFILLLPDSDAGQALHVAERICEAVRTHRIPTNGSSIGMTISAGVSALQDHDASLARLIARADAALYRAKKAGRDRVVVHDDANAV